MFLSRQYTYLFPLLLPFFFFCSGSASDNVNPRAPWLDLQHSHVREIHFTKRLKQKGHTASTVDVGAAFGALGLPRQQVTRRARIHST